MHKITYVCMFKINKTAISEKVKNCSVQIEFVNNDISYILRRRYITGRSETDISVQEFRPTGSLEAMNDEIANTFIQRLIPKELASWFIFDGEAIEKLHLDGNTTFRRDIRQTFGFSALERLIQTLTLINNDYRKKEIKSGENEELNGLSLSIDAYEQELTDHENKITNSKDKIHLYEKTRIEANLRLSQYSQAEPFQIKKEKAKRKLVEAELRKNEILKRII